MSPKYLSQIDRLIFHERVWEIVRNIPPGCVATYGQVASLVAVPDGMDIKTTRAFGARWVGGAMAACPEDVPWQRVVNAQGKISQRGEGAERQRELLEAEGVTFDERGKINLSRTQWRGPEVDDEQLELPL